MQKCFAARLLLIDRKKLYCNEVSSKLGGFAYWSDFILLIIFSEIICLWETAQHRVLQNSKGKNNICTIVCILKYVSFDDIMSTYIELTFISTQFMGALKTCSCCDAASRTKETQKDLHSRGTELLCAKHGIFFTRDKLILLLRFFL